jgi:molybdopterin-guanine dinucleotide biosynthesis protein A
MSGADAVVGVVLAGGRSRRMGGGDKFLRILGGRPILERVVERARPQVAELILNAGGDAARFAGFGLPVVGDAIDGFAGPLAGVLAGLEWAAANRAAAPWVASFAADAPFAPRTLVAELRAAAAAAAADMACAASGGRAHPVFALWPVRLAAELRRAMVEEEMRKIDAWTVRYRLVEVDFALGAVDPFFNINRPQDLARAEGLVGMTEVPA